jgi:acetyl esterase/lipase
MMRTRFVVGVAALCLGGLLPGRVLSQTPPAKPAPQPTGLTDEVVTIPLWEGGAPGALGTADADRPTLTVYRARTPVPTGIIVAPGGGYGNLAMNHEGRQVANWFNALGVTAFVLKYRLGPRYHHPVELGDAQRAIRIARARAQEFGISPDRLGIIGFSAGGHLASTSATRFDAGNPSSADPIERAGSRPDFLILGYPVISFKPEITHRGSVRNLLGENPSQAQIEELSNELHVTERTPPTFLFHTNADPGVSAENSVRFYLALRAAKVPAEMHIFEKGPHGVGLALGDPLLSEWPVLLANWMRGRGLLDK